jgi:hypothetical protein
MIQRLIVITFLISASHSKGQNLIPNASFEDTICSWPGYEDPFDFPYFSHVKDWFNPNNATPDFYVTSPYMNPGECAANSIYNPSLLNVGEWQYPYDGERMLGLWCGNGVNETRDLLEAELISPLIADTLYCFSMHASLGNWQDLACDRLGAFFSLDSVYDHSWAGGFDLPLYVGNPAGEFLTDTADWMLIEGVFLAQGGERYIIIGNAFDDLQTSFQEVEGSTTNGWDVAYYFIDNLSLTSCSQVGITEDSASVIQTYYSPLEAQFIIESPLALEWRLYDLNGSIVASGRSNQGRLGIDATSYASGMYLLHWQSDTAQGSKRLLKR